MNVVSNRFKLFKVLFTPLNLVIVLILTVTFAAQAQRLIEEVDMEPISGVQIKKWTYTSGDIIVKGELYLPPKKGKLPLVIFNHDGTSGISREHRLSSVKLAKAGFVVFSPSFRGEDGSQGEIEIAKGEVEDVLHALTLLKKHAKVQKAKIAMVGASHGALISVLAASRSDDIKAVVAAYGVMDIYRWYAYLKRTGKLGQDAITRRTYGPGPEQRPQSFAIRNAVAVVPKINCPVLLLQGAQDDIVPEEQARLMEKALRKANKDCQIEVYPDALHGFLVYAPYLSDVTEAERQQTESAWQTLIGFLNRKL